MAGSLKTANYELSKYAPNDITSWLVDFNGNMDKIDTQMKANSDANVGTNGTVSALAQRVTVNETKISDLESKIQVNSDNITEVEQTVSDLNGKVTTNENDINTIENKLNDILKVQTFTGSETTLETGTSKAVNISVNAPAGYSTVGVVGFYLGGLKLTVIRISNNRIDVENNSGSQVTFTPTLTVLFIKKGSI